MISWGFGSSLSATASRIQPPTIARLLTVGVLEIGLRSLSTDNGGWTFAKGGTFAIFQTLGTCPSRIDALYLIHCSTLEVIVSIISRPMSMQRSYYRQWYRKLPSNNHCQATGEKQTVTHSIQAAKTCRHTRWSCHRSEYVRCTCPCTGRQYILQTVTWACTESWSSRTQPHRLYILNDSTPCTIATDPRRDKSDTSSVKYSAYLFMYLFIYYKIVHTVQT